MARTLEEMDQELNRVWAELEALKRPSAAAPSFRQFAGCFTGDEELEQIFADIEEKRRIPDPGFSDEARDVAA